MPSHITIYPDYLGSVKLRNNDGPTVLARELHAFLEVRKHYADWFQYQCKYDFVAGRDYAEKEKEITGPGRPRIDHVITLDMAVKICQYQRTEIGNWAAKALLGECAGPRPAPRKPFQRLVYFIATIDSKMVKIGASQDVQARFKKLQAASPQNLYIAAVTPGGTKLERELHHKFSKDHSHFEWFHFSDEIKAYIQENIAPVEEG